MKTETEKRKIRRESPIGWEQVKQIAETLIWSVGGQRGFENFSHGMQERIVKAEVLDVLTQLAFDSGQPVSTDQIVSLRAALRHATGIDRDDD